MSAIHPLSVIRRNDSRPQSGRSAIAPFAVIRLGRVKPRKPPVGCRPNCGHYNKPKSTCPKASRGTIHQGAPLISWSRFCRSVEPNGHAASLTYWAGTIARKDFRHANRHRYTCLSWSDCSSAGARHSCPAERRAGSGSYANKHFSYHEPERQRGRIQSHELPGPRDGPTQPVL